MTLAAQFAIAAVCGFALIFALAPVRADEPDHAAPAAVEHACLNQKERRAETEKLVQLDAAMRVARSRMPGTVVRARLCHGQIAGQEGGLVYVLTVLAHDGKVARITVDAVKGTLVGGL
jgi:uncharacterized membrane protein YkoI